MSTPARGEFHPVFLTGLEVERLRRMIRTDRVAAILAEECLFSPAREDCAMKWRLPPPMAFPLAPSFARFCDPETGTPLIYDPLRRGHYRTAGGARVRGIGYDWAWDAITHDRNARTARRCALAGLLLGDGPLLDRARDILLGYANAYLDYPPRGRQSASWGRLFYQALNESVWSISMLWAFEVLWHAGRLEPEEFRSIRDGLFFPLADLVWGEWYFIHNIRMWHNAALGCIGLAFGDRPLVRRAIHGERGFRQQLVDGYRWKDGFSCEGSPGYHAYGLTAMLFLAEAMQRNGLAPYHDPHLLRAILAPARLAAPNGSPPAMGDMGRGSSLPTRLYGTALGRYPRNAEIRAAAALAYSQWRANGCRADFEGAEWNDTSAYYFRSEVDWLLNGRHLPSADSPRRMLRTCTTFPDSGLAVLRPEPGSCLFLRSAAVTGSHDHYDRLAIVWWESGRCWLDDPGTCDYSLPLHEGWFKHTASHNSALVDGRRQERCAGRIVRADAGCVKGSARPWPEAMPDVTLERALRRIPGGWEDKFLMKADRPRTLDLLFHPRARLVGRMAGKAGKFTAEFLVPGAVSAVKCIPLTQPPYALEFAADGFSLRIEFLSYPDHAILLLGAALSNPQNTREKTPFICLRTTAGEACVVTRLTVRPYSP